MRLLSFLATSVAVYHVRAQGDLQRYIPPFILATALLGAALIIALCRVIMMRQCRSTLQLSKERHGEGDTTKRNEGISKCGITAAFK